jgi:RNA polymerase sigma-70 factor (ECF subfamily)
MGTISCLAESKAIVSLRLNTQDSGLPVAKRPALAIVSASPAPGAGTDTNVVVKEQTNEQLMVAYSQGDSGAFEELLRRHQRPVLNFIFRYVGNRATAEDLVQDVFMRIIRRASSYKREAKFTTWLYTIARNICIDHSRRMTHRRAASLDHPVRSGGEDRRTLGESIPSTDAATDRRAMGRQLGEQIKVAVDNLAEDQREVFLMREYLGLPFKEIAEIVKIPENTAKSRMRYALEKLRTDLSEYEDLARKLG